MELQTKEVMEESLVMSAPIKPLADYVLLQQESVENKTSSGLYIPEGAKEKPKIAKVIAVGPGKVGDDNERIAVGVKVGDRVVYGGYSNTEVKIDGESFLLVREEDIFGVFVTGGKK
jgi:chaperonin GroES